MLGIFLFGIYLIVISLLIRFFKTYNRLKWWVKIDTQSPKCIYYFGPFDSAQEAEKSYGEYLQDLQQEGARGINIKIQQCQPQKLTIFDEEAEMA